MKLTSTIVSGLALIAATVFIGPSRAQTVASGPYYAMPSWDQTIACGTPTNCPRFIVLSNMNSAAVLDRETGLVWERAPSTQLLSFAGAKVRCNEFVTIGNRLGWRMPTVQELASLIDTSQTSPALPPGHPFLDIQLSDYYWTATDDARDIQNQWIVSFLNDGDLSNGTNGSESSFKFAWCVRGGQGVHPQ